VLKRLIAGSRPIPQDGRTREWKIYLLKQADIFRDLSHAEMESIERMTTMTTCRKGRQILSAGDKGEVLFILKQGKVQLSRLTEDGRRLVTAVLEAGSVFGEMPVLSQSLEDSSAEALEDCTLCAMSRSDVENLILTNPRVALNIVHILARRVSDLEKRLEMQAFQTVTERLAATLLRMAGPGNEVSGASHQQIAETIGASRETVTRALGDLRVQGLIELGRSRILIRDRAGLAGLARRAGRRVALGSARAPGATGAAGAAAGSPGQRDEGHAPHARGAARDARLERPVATRTDSDGAVAATDDTRPRERSRRRAGQPAAAAHGVVGSTSPRARAAGTSH
jgi:CRP-like cAMP-binding protein